MRQRLIFIPVLLAIITIGLLFVILRQRPGPTVQLQIHYDSSSKPILPTAMTVKIGSITVLPPELPKKLGVSKILADDELRNAFEDHSPATRSVGIENHPDSPSDNH